MAKTRQQKEKEVKDLKENLETMKSMVIINYRGLKVAETEDLRKQLRAEEGSLKMAKINLLRIALKNAKLDKLIKVEDFSGTLLSLAFGFGDEVVPAKITGKFRKDHENLKILGGILEGRFLTEAEITVLSQIPSRTELLTKLVGSIAAPLRGLVSVLQGNLRGLVTVLNAIQEKKGN